MSREALAVSSPFFVKFTNNSGMEEFKGRECCIGTSFLRDRELGMRPKLGSTDRFMKKFYNAFAPCTSWDHNSTLQNAMPGGIFNLEFSPDGSLLVAACEKRSILMFDPLSRQLLHTVDNAHLDCVNCVRFLDSRVFATCSDDSTVALWDARHLKSRIRTLHGHSNWVKNIEFSQSDGLLVTSGFDGAIYTWDINSYTENGFLYNRVFHTNGLMRTRLNPDASKMIICTTGGYLIVIHNLDLRSLAQDLDGFKPNMYRLMQLSRTTIPVAANFTHLFSKKRKKNRIEFLTDFPEGDDAEVVSSLQVHPQGWCALSRNISNDESSEWTCVHDIQESPTESGSSDHSPEHSAGEESETESSESHSQSEISSLVIGLNSRARLLSASEGGRFPRRVLRRQNAFRGFRATLETAAGGAPVSPGRGTAGAAGGGGVRGVAVRGVAELATVASTDVWEALLAIREARAQRSHDRGGGVEDGPHGEQHQHQAAAAGGRGPVETTQLRIVRMQSGLGELQTSSILSRSSGSLLGSLGYTRVGRGQQQQGSREGEHPGGEDPGAPTGSPPRVNRSYYIIRRPAAAATAASSSPAAAGCGLKMKIPKNHRIHQNSRRLTHFIEETNVGKGFIKELCFSADGRLICSPYGYGVRLLAFSPNCSELSACVPKNPPAKLVEIATNACHSDIVVSTKFSPRHCLLVSGCLTGRIVWHQPVL